MSDKTFSQVLTFTRASTGTYFDSAGALQTAAVDEPRFTHDPVTLEPLGLLIEEQRTNLLLWNRDLTNAVWVGTATANLDASGLDGAANSASTLTDLDTLDNLTKRQDISIAANSSTYITSFFIKKDADETRFPELTTSLTGVLGESATINTSTGQITARRQTGGSSEVRDYRDFWKITQTITNNGSGTTLRLQIAPAHNSDGGSGQDTNATGSVIVDYIGVELGGFTTSPIKTEASQVTRSADNCTRTLGSEFNASEGALRITANAPIGTVLARLGTFEVVSDFDGEKTYAESYTSDPSATELEILPDGSGTMKSLKYENGAL